MCQIRFVKNNFVIYLDLYVNSCCNCHVHFDFSSKTLQEFEVTVPDSITSWVATAFVINEDLGLGLTTTPVEVK